MATKTCPRCGNELPSETLGGLCPCCLVQAGIDLNERAEDGGQKSEVSGQKPEDVAAAIASRKSQVADLFGDYELLEEIGRGGMGVVYRARQRSLDRVVAIKMMAFGPSSSPELVKRFRAEAVSAASLHHPNIVAIHEVGIHEGQHFFVMDYVAGQNLTQLAGSRPLPVKRAAAYLKIVAEAVHYAHERGILHRDLKPSNVLIDAQDQPHVVDFGLARRLEVDSELTVTGQVLGSPHYLPPEQASGQRTRVSRRTDVYALGATLYHLLTGRPPFQAESLAQTLDLVLHADPVAPRLLNPSVPHDLETICLKCLEKEPARRYPTAEVLADELARFQAGEPIQARPLGAAGKTWRWCRRNPRLALAVGAALLSLLVGLAGVTVQWRRADWQRKRAEANEYVLAINVAQEALKDKNPGRALELLYRYRPVEKSEILPQGGIKSEFDLRGFEWCYLWQQCQTDAEAVVDRLPGSICSLEVSPDGHWLAAGSSHGTVKVWSLVIDEEISLGPNRGVKAYATFSPDSRLVLFTDQGMDVCGTIGMMDLQTRQHLAPITNLWIVGPMAFSPDGKWFGYGVLSPTYQRKVVVRDFLNQTNIGEVHPLTGITSDHHGAAWVFSHDGRGIIGTETAPDRRIVLLDITGTGKPQHFRGHDEAITAIAISPDGRTLATGAGFTETGIKLWEVPSFRLLGEFAGHEKWIAGLQFSPDGQMLASASADQTIRLWDVPTRKLKWVSGTLPQEAWRVCFLPGGRKLLSGTKDGWIHRWSPDAPQAQPGFWLQPAGLNSVAFAPDGKQFAGIQQGGVCMGETERVALPRPLPELGTNNTCLLYSADGQSLFAGTSTGEVQVWSVPRRQLLRPVRSVPEPVRRLRRDNQGRILVVVKSEREDTLQIGRSTRIEVWNLVEWQEHNSWRIPGIKLPCAVSPDGRWFATGRRLGGFQLWNLTGWDDTNSVSFAAGTITSLEFSPDGRLLAASDAEGTIQLWEMPAFRELPCIRAHPGAVNALAFTPDSRRLATASAGEESIRLWDVATRQRLITLQRNEETLNQLSFSADGHQLTASNSRGDLLCWRVPPFAEIDARAHIFLPSTPGVF